MKYLSYITFIFVAVFLCLPACKKMDFNYKKYIDQTNSYYPGKPVNVKFHPGKNRAMISWNRGTDPKVVKARIYWNNFTDSVEVLLDPKQDSVAHIFTGLSEMVYTYTLCAMDEEGHKSVPIELSGAVYGDRYQGTLLSRPMLAAVISADKKLRMVWGSADTTNGAVGTQVKYTDAAGKTIVKRYPAKKDTSVAEDVRSSAGFEYRTLYLPDSLAIDTFYTAYEKVNSEQMQVDRSTWIATADSYELYGQLPSGHPRMVLDGNVDTYWHTNHSQSPVTGYPHWLAFDMTAKVKVQKIVLQSRAAYFKEDFTNFKMQSSNDGITWADEGSFVLAETPDPQFFILPNAPVTRYIRIYQLGNATGSPHSHLAEFSIYGSYVE
ncbi:DUF4998 domain-containing protein [Chitinophaga arvensicola]|uniref:F5/8 type C domain-containing protein n=1 Tax=Chitinophaga arvensicola TaxID=29529 RepID=A0A1I0S7S6_9BACT|nr:DUF4998 domain-containing protein [Chitinophaga arvensicola]SEW51853.1 F5/8 type C domain-containing protein [Chitinophaga arvensicola]